MPGRASAGAVFRLTLRRRSLCRLPVSSALLRGSKLRDSRTATVRLAAVANTGRPRELPPRHLLQPVGLQVITCLAPLSALFVGCYLAQHQTRIAVQRTLEIPKFLTWQCPVRSVRDRAQIVKQAEQARSLPEHVGVNANINGPEADRPRVDVPAADAPAASQNGNAG